MANAAFNTAKRKILDGTLDLTADTLKVMLVNDTYSVDIDMGFIDDGTANDPQSHEISVTGYVGGFGGGGRKTLTTKTFSTDNVNNRGEFLADNLTWTALGVGATIGGAVILKEITNDAASIPIAFIDLTDTPTNGSDFTITWDLEGILQLA